MTDTTVASADGGNGAAPIQAAPESWYSGFDQETVSWMENRGLTKMDATQALDNTIRGFRNAEKYMGVPHEKLARVPDWDKADPAELNQFFDKLGRPKTPQDYGIQALENDSFGYAEAAAAKFHEIGLTPRQAKELEKWNNDFGTQIQAKTQEQFQLQIQQEAEALKREWGQAYDQEINFAKNAAQGLGLKPEQIDAMEQALGHAGLMKLMSGIGKKIGEDSFVSNAGTGGFGAMTPAAAQGRIAQLQNDKEWTAKYLAGNIQARAEMEKLMEAAYPS